MNPIVRTFLKGLAAVLPIAVTIYALIWLAVSAETVMQKAMHLVLPDLPYTPGMGIAVGLGVIYLVGFFLNLWIAQWLFGIFENILDRIPLIKSLYGSVKDLLGFFMGGDKQQKGQVVMVKLDDADMRIIGLMTREDFSDLPEGVGTDDEVAVYVPMSYNLGGYTVMVPRSRVEKIKMSTEAALRFAVTAGVKASEEKK